MLIISIDSNSKITTACNTEKTRTIVCPIHNYNILKPKYNKQDNAEDVDEKQITHDLD